LRLDGQTLADIFQGKISNWNDKRIADLNPGVKIPSGDITVVHRADGSGTTAIFTDYLAKVSADWKSVVGAGAAVKWPAASSVGGKGNEGVAANVGRIKNSIGYVEYAYTKKNNMPFVLMRNPAGQFVAPDDLTFAAAAAGTDWAKIPGMGAYITNAPGATSWPITGASFILMYKTPVNKANSAEVLKFFDFAFKEGKKMAADLDCLKRFKMEITADDSLQHLQAVNIAKRQRLIDFGFKYLTQFFALSVLFALLGIIASLVFNAAPALSKFGFGFFTTIEWDIINGEFGGLIAIYGTVITSIIALLIAVPLSFGIAVFLTEICPTSLRRPLGTAIEILAAVPSIIYGMFGLFIFAPLFAEYVQPALAGTLGQIPGLKILFTGAFNGIGILCAGLILAMMVLPFIASVMRDVFEIVPPVLKESAYGIGCTTWEVVKNVVLPYTKTGVIGGIMLGLGRALGETMAVTFVIGNAHKLSASLFAPGNSIASTLANEFGEAEVGVHYSSLFALGLALFAITFLVLAIAKIMLMRMEKNQGVKT